MPLSQPTDPLERENTDLVFTVLSALYTRAVTGTTPATRSYSTAQLRTATGITSGTVLRRILRALFRRDLVTIDQPKFNPECDDYRWTITVAARFNPRFREKFDILIGIREPTTRDPNG